MRSAVFAYKGLGLSPVVPPSDAQVNVIVKDGMKLPPLANGTLLASPVGTSHAATQEVVRRPLSRPLRPLPSVVLEWRELEK